jgi:hypothetical protein
MYVTRWCWREWGEGREEEMDEREMMGEMRDSRAAAQSATVLTHNSFHFSFLISPIPVTA